MLPLASVSVRIESAFDEVFEADLAADFGENRHRVRIPLAEDLAGLDLVVFVDEQHGTVGNRVLFELAVLRVDDDHFAVSGEHDVLAFGVDHAADAGELDAYRPSSS